MAAYAFFLAFGVAFLPVPFLVEVACFGAPGAAWAPTVAFVVVLVVSVCAVHGGFLFWLCAIRALGANS
jgi:hypothetical protein